MKFYTVRTPILLRILFPSLTWHKSRNERSVYLTFDDGPIPEVTDWVLQQLEKYEARATFFCIGDNVVKHPEIFKKVIEKGHSIGNHTFNHLSAWEASSNNYRKNTELAEQAINSNYPSFSRNKLFRPPYGKITFKTARNLKNAGYKIIMWDIVSGDFDENLSKEQCLKNVITNITNGSIIVFHDSLKASDRLKYVLPKTLEYLKSKGFTMKAIA